MLMNHVLLTLLSPLAIIAHCAIASVPPVNLLENGGFESGGEGWVAEAFNFSRETIGAVQSHIERLPAADEILKGEQMKASDGTVLWKRNSDGTWPAEMLGAIGYWRDNDRGWYESLRREDLWQSSRFGEPPLPDGLDLGDVTLVLSARQKQQVMSKTIKVKPDTGYRLSFWVRTSGGGDYVRFAQVLDVTAANPESIPPFEDHYNTPAVLNALPASNWWGSGTAGRYWAKMELPFRTGATCDRIVIRLPFNMRSPAERQRMGNVNYRVWYDDLRLVEDNTVRMGDAGYAERVAPKWPSAVIKRGFVTASRATLPITFSSYKPDAKEADGPITLSLAAGETGSAVIVVRNLMDEDVIVVAQDESQLTSTAGFGLHQGYGARFITIRAAEMELRRLEAKRFVYTPKFLLNSCRLAIHPGHAGQFWMSLTVPSGTPPGEYVGHVKITRTQPGNDESGQREVNLPIKLTVRDIQLDEPDVAYFTWYHTLPIEGAAGSATALPGAEEIYLSDQRRHGMNTVAAYCYAERQGEEGVPKISFNELDAMVEYVRRAGLCRNQPLLLCTWSGALEKRGQASFGSSAYAYGAFAGGTETVAAIAEHATMTGWPQILFAVGDEPASDSLAPLAAQIITQTYTEPRKQGVRTVVATGRWGALIRPFDAEGRTMADLYDVWIEAMSGSDWPAMHEAAAKHDAQLWMYNCWTTGAGYLQERFYSGLWTWRTGAKGNGAWSYGWYVRINDSGLPESKIAWEGRAAGVTDYRYLHTLERAIAAAGEAAGTSEAVQSAQAFLNDLRRRIPFTAYRAYPGNVPQNQWAELDAWNPVRAIEPEDYDEIRNQCARHIAALAQN